MFRDRSKFNSSNNPDALIMASTESGGAHTPHVVATTSTQQFAGTPSNYAPATADGTVFTLAAGERGFIQNLDTEALLVKLGAGASTSSFSFSLRAGAAADDGQGGAYWIDSYVGAVSVAALTGTARYLAFKQAAA